MELKDSTGRVEAICAGKGVFIPIISLELKVNTENFYATVNCVFHDFFVLVIRAAIVYNQDIWLKLFNITLSFMQVVSLERESYLGNIRKFHVLLTVLSHI